MTGVKVQPEKCVCGTSPSLSQTGEKVELEFLGRKTVCQQWVAACPKCGLAVGPFVPERSEDITYPTPLNDARISPSFFDRIWSEWNFVVQGRKDHIAQQIQQMEAARERMIERRKSYRAYMQAILASSRINFAELDASSGTVEEGLKEVAYLQHTMVVALVDLEETEFYYEPPQEEIVEEDEPDESPAS